MKEVTIFHQKLIFLLLFLVGILHAVQILIPASDQSWSVAHDAAVGTQIETSIIAQSVLSYSFTQSPDDGNFVDDYSGFPEYKIKVAKTPMSSGTYTLVVTAHGSSGATDTRTITITVTGGGNPNNFAPVFQALTGPVYVVEDSNTGKSVISVTATDDDSTSPENQVTYSISGTKFAIIDSSSGLISVAESLDYTTQQVYEPVVTATDGAASPKSATITVTVSIETRPIWTQPAPGSNPKQSISESSTADIYTLTAADEDNSGTLQYSLAGSVSSKFIIDGSTLKPKPGETFDVDAPNADRSYTITVSVSDGKYSASTDATLTVDITDENDSPPVFDPADYSISYTTDVSNGDSIVTVTATDADYSSANNVVTYSLLGADDDVFSINSSTGEITVDDVSRLNDYVSSISLVVYARDNGSPQNTASATIKVTSDCRTPPTPDHGTVELDSTETTYQATATQSCNTGYNRSGTGTITCLSTGLWSESSTCSIVDCHAPPVPEHGTVSLAGTETTYQATATQSCDTGYNRSGTGTITCLSTGLWSESSTCSIVDCNTPPAPEHGTVNLDGTETTYQATATQSCNTGYNRSGTGTITCLSTGIWSESSTCSVVDCNAPSAPEHGAVNLDGTETTYQTTATQSCDTGYNLSGTGTITCLSSGLWSESSTCPIVDCLAPTALDHGTVNLDGTETTYQATATQSCDTGYKMSGTGIITCLSSGSWSESSTCSIVDCLAPTALEHGTVNLDGTETTYQATATQSCDAGYNLTGTGTITCLSSGLWSESSTCSIVDCNTPPTPEHGTVNLDGTETTYQATATQSCDLGYNQSGTGTITCLSTGLWSDSSACLVVDCHPPPVPQHGTVNLDGTETTYRATATQSCDTGYNLTGTGTITCLSTGIWSESSTCSIVDCHALPAPEHGTVNLDGTETTYQATATQSCDTGYNRSGTGTITCLSTGLWSESSTCSIVDCGALENPTHGTVFYSNTTYGSLVTYTCGKGYRLLGVAVRVCKDDGIWNNTAPTCYMNETTTTEAAGSSTVTIVVVSVTGVIILFGAGVVVFIQYSVFKNKIHRDVKRHKRHRARSKPFRLDNGQTLSDYSYSENRYIPYRWDKTGHSFHNFSDYSFS